MKSRRLSLAMALTSLILCATQPTYGQQFKTDSGSQRTANAFAKAHWIFDNAQTTHYKHNKLTAEQQWQVGAGTCGMEADCSGFVSYVLHSVAPNQYENIHALQPDRPYPQSKTFAKFFNSLSNSAPTNGWIRVSSFSDLRRGDVIAWEKPLPPGSRGNTGHVMFVAQRPGAVEMINGKKFVPITVLDSSSVTHFPPETLPPHTHQRARDGLGKGVIRLLLDADNKPIGYWEGTYSAERKKQISEPTLSNNIGFGRLVDTSN